MTDTDSGNFQEEDQPVEFYKEKDLFGLEKPILHPEQEKEIVQESGPKQVTEVFIPGAPYSEYQSVRNFCILCFFSFGIYKVYWFYKHWRFLRYERQLNIMPALRTLFTIFTGFSLFRQFYKLSVEKGYQEKPMLGFLFIAYILLSLSAYLPDIERVIALFSFVPLLPVLRMMNFYYLKEQPNYNIRKKFSKGEKRFLLIIWIPILILIYLYWSQPAIVRDNYFILGGDE